MNKKCNCNHGVRNQSIYVGIVKGNDDPQKMGRLSVWIPELGGDPDSTSSHYTVSYASPFAGASNPNDLTKDGTDMDGSQTSYGMWMQPPDIENQVLVCFANGDVGKGFWFACLWQQNMNHMVPGIAASQTTSGTHEPSVEYNKRSDANVNSPRRPVFEPLRDGLKNQGLEDDHERGPASSSARRESPSGVFGILSPRGNQFYIDDQPDNEFIRMRTRNGAQVLVHNTTGYVYINSKDGASWIEVSDVGVDIYSRGKVSLRAESDLNLASDANVNIEAGQNINLKAGTSILGSAGSAIGLTSGAGTIITGGANVEIGAGGNLVLSGAGTASIKAGGDVNSVAGGNNNRVGAKVNDNSGGDAADAAAAEAAGTTSRKPAHEPWDGHPAPTSYDDEGHDGETEDDDGFTPAAFSAAAEAGEGSWLIPCNGRVGSQFGYRIHPISGRRKMHNGIDISRNANLPIYATRGGTVKTAGFVRGYGNFVEIDHGNGLTSRYAHMKSISVRSGQRIKQGAVVGVVGSTGGSTGPHLHFEIRFRGSPVNPKSSIPELGAVGSTVRGGSKSGG